jgi:hypothetical protein
VSPRRRKLGEPLSDPEDEIHVAPLAVGVVHG